MRKSLKIGIALVAAIGLSLGPAAAAMATAWDGNAVAFQNGAWDFNSDGFYMDDVYVIDPANSSSPTYNEYTDIWDGAGEFYVSLNDWSTYALAGATSDADVDQAVDPVTGDLVYSAAMFSTGTPWEGKLDITGEVRVYSAGDLVRSTFFVTNTTGAPVTASFDFYTDWGTGGEIFNYQGQSDSILAVPAVEDITSATALTGANVQWIVHTESDDAPGAMAYGLKSASNPGDIKIDGDSYVAYYNTVTIPAGATIAFAEFHNWTPALLIADNYTNSDGNSAHQDAYAAAATTAAAEFDTFSGRLTNGLTGYNVVNWGDLSEAPALPDTGVNATTAMTVGIGASALVIAGLAIVMVRRRSNA